MKRKYMGMILVMAFIVAMAGGCSLGNKNKAVSDGADEDAVYGEVSQVTDNSITIQVGTVKEHNQDSRKDDTSRDATKDKPDAQAKGEAPSMLDLTGEEQVIKITDDTVIQQQSRGQGGGEKMENAPEKPDGENSPSASGDGTALEKPNKGNAPEDNMPEGNMSEQQKEEIALSDISEGDTVSVTLDEDGNADEITVISRGFGKEAGGTDQTNGVDSYEAVTEYTRDTTVDGDSFASTGTDENAIHVFENAIVNLKNILVSRTSSDSTGGDNSSFYGVGAAALATDGTTYISNATIETDAAGGAGIFAYGDATVYTADTNITTKQDTSGGIHVAGGGSLFAWNMDITTNGQSAAAIRSDRGGGKVRVDGGTYTSNGVGSPAIYSTADIAVHAADLTANGSEAICIEGRNSIHLFDCNLTGTMSDDSQNDNTWNVILYQSMSGDSEEGNSIFEMNGGSLTAQNGGMFYTTNTESTITLSDVDITYAKDSEFFLQCSGNHNQRGWGGAGQNGADCLFTAVKQDMEGDVIWDSISKLDFYMTQGSSLKGAVKKDETYAADGEGGYCKLYIEKDSSWTVTEDSVLSQLCSEGTILDRNGKTVTIQGSDGTVYVKGESSYTVTVDSYEDTVDISGASDTTSWSDYQETKPSELE